VPPRASHQAERLLRLSRRIGLPRRIRAGSRSATKHGSTTKMWRKRRTCVAWRRVWARGTLAREMWPRQLRPHPARLPAGHRGHGEPV